MDGLPEFEDELIYVEEHGIVTRDGKNIDSYTAHFTDGSRLTVTVEVPCVPADELTPSDVDRVDLSTGEHSLVSDNGFQEDFGLMSKSGAYRLSGKFISAINELPARWADVCPDCDFDPDCPTCGGYGWLREAE